MSLFISTEWPTLIIQILQIIFIQIIIMIFLSIPSRLILKIGFGFARARRNSEWIYSSKAQQMSHVRKGSIFICSHPGNDSYNCTLRMHKTLQKSHLVLSQNTNDAKLLLQCLANKVRFPSKENQSAEDGIQLFKDNGQLVSFNESESKKRDFDSMVQHSKHLQMALQVERINRSNNDRQNKLLKKQQEELNKFMASSNTKEKLQTFKKQHGFPRIVHLIQNLPKIQQLRNGGINIFCFLNQNQSLPSKALFNYLQQKNIPYEVLPVVNRIINLLASSGFPADRFAIQYFPLPIIAALQKRKPMKMTVGIVLQSKNIISTIQAIKGIYGGHQMVYLQSQQGSMIFRGKASEFETQKIVSIEGNIVRMAIAPFISSFNQELKEQRNNIERLYGQAMSSNTHEVRIEFINKELRELLKRKDTRKISVNSLMQELIARTTPDKAASIASEVLGLKEKQAEVLLKRAQAETVMDHVGIQDYTRRK